MTEFTLVGLDGDESDEIEIISDERTTLDLKRENNTQKKQKKKQNDHPVADLAYTIDKEDEPHPHQSSKKIRTYSRPKHGTSKPVVNQGPRSTSNTTTSNKSHTSHVSRAPSTSSGHVAHTTAPHAALTDTVFILPAKQRDEQPLKKRARESSDEDSAPLNKKQRAEAQPFLEKMTEKFRAPQPVITLPNIKVTPTREEKKRNNSKRTVPEDSRDITVKTSKLGKESSVFRAGSNTHPLTVSDELTPVKQVSRVNHKHKSRVEERSRDQDSVEVVILNDADESPLREIDSTFLDMTGDETKRSREGGEDEEASSSCDQSFDLFDSQPLTASRDSKLGALPRLALVCVQIGAQVVRDTDVKGEFVLRVKSECLSVSAVDASSPPIEIEISDNLLQVQYSALHRLLVLRLKTPPVSLAGFYRNSDRPCMALILAEELSEEHKRHLQSMLQARDRKLDKYDDRKLKIDLVPDVYAQYVKLRHQGVDLTLSSDHAPLEIHGEIHDGDEARDDAEYRARDSESPPQSKRILRSSRASVQSAEEIHAEIEHKRANVLCVWPKGARDSVSITELDLARLEPNEFLNDVIIDFYLMWIRDHVVPPALRNKIYFYNSFFYNLLTRKSQGYNKVKKWTKHVNIFDYDYLVVPINQHFHWRVCIVYHPRRLLSSASDESSEDESAAPYLIMLDSLQGTAGSVYRAIKEYLQKEWQDKHGTRTDIALDMTRLKTAMPKAPTQDNHYDCGIFVLQYVESFCKKPVASPSYITASWFTPAVIANKRRDIRNIILKLAEEQGHHVSNSKTAWESADESRE